MKIIDTIARLLFRSQLDAARREGRADAERAQEQWNQTVVNAAGQQDSRRKYLEKELATVKGYAEDLARLVLRKSKNFNDNSVYPDDRALGFDGYGTVITMAVAEQSLKSKMGLPRHSNWRHKAGIAQQPAAKTDDPHFLSEIPIHADWCSAARGFSTCECGLSAVEAAKAAG